MICSPTTIIALTNEVFNIDDQIKKLEQTVKKCNDKKLDGSVFQDEIKTKQRWKQSMLDGIELENKKCELFKILQSGTDH